MKRILSIIGLLILATGAHATDPTSPGTATPYNWNPARFQYVWIADSGATTATLLSKTVLDSIISSSNTLSVPIDLVWASGYPSDENYSVLKATASSNFGFAVNGASAGGVGVAGNTTANSGFGGQFGISGSAGTAATALGLNGGGLGGYLLRGYSGAGTSQVASLSAAGVLTTSGTINAQAGVSSTTATLTGLLTAGTVNTGQGATEVYLQNQNLRTTDAVTHTEVTATTTTATNAEFDGGSTDPGTHWGDGSVEIGRTNDAIAGLLVDSRGTGDTEPVDPAQYLPGVIQILHDTGNGDALDIGLWDLAEGIDINQYGDNHVDESAALVGEAISGLPLNIDVFGNATGARINKVGLGPGTGLKILNAGTSPSLWITSGKSGFWESAPEGVIHAKVANYTDTPVFERTGTTDSDHSALRIKATKNSDMGAGFGASIHFQVEDSTGTANNIGAVTAFWDGTDDTGKIALRTYEEGSIQTIATVSNSGLDVSGQGVFSGNIYSGVGLAYDGTTLKLISTSGDQWATERYANDAFGASMRMRKSRGSSLGTNTIAQSGDIVGQLVFQMATGSTWGNTAMISSTVAATPGATTDFPGSLIFSTTPDGSGTLTERARFTPDGAFQVTELAANPAIGSSSGPWNVYAKGDKLVFAFNHAGDDKYWYIDGTGTGTALTYSSTAP